MSDSLVFSESVETESSEPIFLDKQWLYVNDNNAQSYTGQVVLDSTSLSNSGAYMGWNEAFLAIPRVLQMQGSANLPVTAPLDFGMGMKSGFCRFFIICRSNSITVQLYKPLIS